MTPDLSRGGPVSPGANPTDWGECPTSQPVCGLPLSGLIQQPVACAPENVRPDARIRALLPGTFARVRHAIRADCTQIVEVGRRDC